MNGLSGSLISLMCWTAGIRVVVSKLTLNRHFAGLVLRKGPRNREDSGGERADDGT